MEARRFGFGASMPPAYKFDPTDADIVAHYLLPRAVGVPNPYAHAVIDADPCSCPPWELLRRHGHAGSDHAFFFGPVPKKTKSGRRVAKRAVSEGEEGGGGGGTWVVLRYTEASLVLLRGGGGGGGAEEIELRYKKRYLSHRSNEDARRATGWVMDEYEITDPPLHGAVLSRVRITARGKNKFQKHQAAAAKKVAPGPEQPGPSNYLDDDDGPVAANYVVMGQGEGTSGGAQADQAVDQGDNSGGFLGEMAGGYYSALHMPSAGEDSGYYALPVPSAGETAGGYYSALPMPSAGEDGGYYDLPVPSSGETAGYYSALLGAEEDGGYYVDNSNSYFSEGITFDYFNEDDGNGDYFLQDDSGNGD